MALKHLVSVLKFECAWCSNSSVSKYIRVCVCASECVYVSMLYNPLPQKSIMFIGDNWGADLLHILL